jgi:hypothetical protein
MKAFLFIFFMSCNAAVFSQANVVVEWTTKTNLPETETIYYHPDTKLKWENFEGAPIDMGIVAAITFSGFGYQAEMKTVDGKSILKIKKMIIRKTLNINISINIEPNLMLEVKKVEGVMRVCVLTVLNIIKKNN